jgi:endonuclease/exonuclease/phosphatase (EEP) superfamily protein YafD
MSMPIRMVSTLVCLYVGIVAVVGLIYAVGPERLMWGGVLLFLPQLVLALPGLILLPFALWRARRLTWLIIAALLLIAGPLMGFSWSSSEESEGFALRVMTYNVQLWARRNVPAILDEILAADPDVLCLQDARDVKNTRLSSYLEHRNVAMFGQYAFVSRFPIVDATVGDISYDGETHTYLRARIDVAGTEVVVFNAHLVTPRDALSPLRSPALWRLGLSEMRQNQSQRLRQARQLLEDSRGITGPLVIAGDLNAPPASLVTRMLTDRGLVDAFSAAGRGYGYTFGHTLLIGRPFLRLDRILASRHLTPVRAWVGGASGSDHRPVIADLMLAKPAQR